MQQHKSIQFVLDELAKVIRRIDGLQKTVDLLFQDREILENIQGRLTGVEEQLKLSREHDNLVRKDIKEEINNSGARVEMKVEEKIEEMTNKIESVPDKVIIKKKEGILRRLANFFSKKEVKIEKL